MSTPKKLRRWQYLQTIASETVQNPPVPVGLLIGTNFLSALELTEFIGSKAGGPYAYKTKLGWCIVSSIDIEGIRKVFVLFFFYERYFRYKKHKQKHLSNIQPNISISKKTSK